MLEKYSRYSPIAIRYSVGIVFFLIGIDQLLKPDLWASYFPDWITTFSSISTFVTLNGIFDAAIGAFLLLGLLTRLVSAIAVLHLLGVIYTLGYNDIAIRDLGILIAAIAVFMHGPDEWSLDRKLWPKRS